MNLEWYELSRGPLFKFAVLFFVFGMSYRLFVLLFLGWKKNYAPPRGSAFNGVVKAFAYRLVPESARREVYGRRPLTVIATYLFHIGAFIVILFQPAHVKVWGEILGFEWGSWPIPIVDFAAAMTLVTFVILVIDHLTHPVRKLTTTTSDWLSLIFVFLPLLTGWMTYHHLWFPYQTLFTFHMLAVDWLLIWIPLSKMSHFLYFIVGNLIHGVKFGKMGTL
jgi:nitrate reductase gamma subunit